MGFLVDVNLPKKFSFFNNADFTHVSDINPCMEDEDIWEYAKENKLIILTKDVDFHHKSLLDKDGPVVVYFKLGNKTLSELHFYFSNFWPVILDVLGEAKLIIAYANMVKIIH